jgi:hypothetical protein
MKITQKMVEKAHVFAQTMTNYFEPAKGRLESQRRSVPFDENPDRKLCFLSFPIAQSNRSPDIQRLLQRFKFRNNIHL